ncbi:ricin B lectin domain-containing protein, partial [Roridomyces roridus]
PVTSRSAFIHPSVDAGRCLTATSSTDGTPVTISSCIPSGSASQNWSISSAGTLVLYGNKCLNVPNGATTSGTLLQISTCGTGNPNQAWTVDSTAGSISWTGKGFCMDLTKGADADG